MLAALTGRLRLDLVNMLGVLFSLVRQIHQRQWGFILHPHWARILGSVSSWVVPSMLAALTGRLRLDLVNMLGVLFSLVRQIHQRQWGFILGLLDTHTVT